MSSLHVHLPLLSQCTCTPSMKQFVCKPLVSNFTYMYVVHEHAVLNVVSCIGFELQLDLTRIRLYPFMSLIFAHHVMLCSIHTCLQVNCVEAAGMVTE